MLTCSPAQAQAVALAGKCMRSRLDASQNGHPRTDPGSHLNLLMHSDQRPRRHGPAWVCGSAGRGRSRYKGAPER